MERVEYIFEEANLVLASVVSSHHPFAHCTMLASSPAHDIDLGNHAA